VGSRFGSGGVVIWLGFGFGGWADGGGAGGGAGFLIGWGSGCRLDHISVTRSQGDGKGPDLPLH